MPWIWTASSGSNVRSILEHAPLEALSGAMPANSESRSHREKSLLILLALKYFPVKLRKTCNRYNQRREHGM
jgi:hypothetical protein